MLEPTSLRSAENKACQTISVETKVERSDKAYLLKELHANCSVILVGTSHLLHVFNCLCRLAFQHSDLTAYLHLKQILL